MFTTLQEIALNFLSHFNSLPSPYSLSFFHFEDVWDLWDVWDMWDGMITNEEEMSLYRNIIATILIV